MVIFLCGVLVFALSSSLANTYHDTASVESKLQLLKLRHPDLVNVYDVGVSREGRKLTVVAVGKLPTSHVSLRPNVKYVGNMHGNEVVGREVLLKFVEFLLDNYSANSEVGNLLNTTLIHVLVSMNPDGFEKALRQTELHPYCTDAIGGRENAANIDLNRNFPDMFEINSSPIQPETRAIMNWLKNESFVLSANFHGGALLVNYPYDNYPRGSVLRSPKYHKSPDDALFKNLSLTYSLAHPRMPHNEGCGYRSDFLRQGITNGANWYPAIGVMQDYNYYAAGCFEITVELGCCKFPKPAEIDRYWAENRESLLKYAAAVHRGVKGVIVDELGAPLVGAKVKVNDRKHPVLSNRHGEFWRLLLPGSYTFKFYKAGFEPHLAENVVVTDNKVAILNVTLISMKPSLFSSGTTKHEAAVSIFCIALYLLYVF